MGSMLLLHASRTSLFFFWGDLLFTQSALTSRMHFLSRTGGASYSFSSRCQSHRACIFTCTQNGIVHPTLPGAASQLLLIWVTLTISVTDVDTAFVLHN